MDMPAVAEVERALQRVGIDGSALAAMMAMVRSLATTPHVSTTRPCRCGAAVDQFDDGELPKLSTIARRFHRDSLRRSDVVGTPIEDASWNMMLAIYADAAEGGYTSTTSACFASGAPQTTALRYIERLSRDGLITRHADPFDARRTLLKPTGSAAQKIENMIRAFCIPRPSRGNN